jgi:hypothetical protein
MWPCQPVSVDRLSGDLLRQTASGHRHNAIEVAPPHGSTDARVEGKAKRLGMSEWLWTIDP